VEVYPKSIKVFCLSYGKQPFLEWLNALRDERAAAKIKARLARVRLGNFGSARSVGEGVQELKVDYGPGYRVYFAQSGNELVILLCGGDKGDQDEDIKSAKEYWATYKREKGNANY
jgi:putative addiction module killer protein